AGNMENVSKIKRGKVLMGDTGKDDGGSPAWQINLEQGAQTSEQEIGLAREGATVATGDRATPRPGRGTLQFGKPLPERSGGGGGIAGLLAVQCRIPGTLA